MPLDTSSGLPLVLLHFFGSSHREWGEVRLTLAAERRSFAFDLPGFGDAAHLTPATVAEMAEFVDIRIRAAGLDACVVVGHSMSAKVAALLASWRPAYLEGLVLVTASPPSPEPMDPATRRRLLAFDHSRPAAESYVDGLTAERLSDSLREVAIDDAMRASPAAWRAWIEDGSQEDCSQAIGLLDIPALVIAGGSDPSLGAGIQRELVLPHVPRAQFTVIDGGHALPLENAAGLHRACDAFVRMLDATRLSSTDLIGES